MNLTETVKKFLKHPSVQTDVSSEVEQKNIIQDLSDTDLYPNTASFFDERAAFGNLFDANEVQDILTQQKQKIMTYRNLAQSPDVVVAIDEIVNEIVFVYDDTLPLKLNINEENDKLVEAINSKFEKILKLLDIKRNLYNIVKTGYIDGQIILHTAYDEKNAKNGIKSIKLIEPTLLYLDKRDNKYKYMSDDNIMQFNGINTKQEYSIEEICREDFGLYNGKLNLGYLDYAIKPANLLSTLEDLLVPMRFSRSISRRVFNVDIGDLPGKRGFEIMKDYQNKFKYKKFYNNETGEVSNQQHITSMVEDYWFANRSGGKGTTVDVLDESGNLGELDDILYFNKKLYKALKIPASRINSNSDADGEFDYDSTRVTKEDMTFFMFISRLRQVYSSLFKELLKREVISTGIMSSQEWEDKENLIEISFVNENSFIEKMKLDNFMSKLDIYSTAQEYAGKLFSVNTVLSKIFKMTEEEIKDEFKKIQKEEKDPLMAKFYSTDEFE